MEGHSPQTEHQTRKIVSEIANRLSISEGDLFFMWCTRMSCYDEMLSIFSFPRSTYLQEDWQTAHQIDCHFFWAFSRHRHDCPFCDSMRSSSKKMRHSFSPNDFTSKLCELINVNQFFSSTVCLLHNELLHTIGDELSTTMMLNRWYTLDNCDDESQIFFILSAPFPARFTLR